MAQTRIKGTLKEQKHHSDNQPSLLGELTVGDKQYLVAGWINFHDDGSISISLEDTVEKKESEEEEGE